MSPNQSKNFISSFWFKFGREDARALAEARRAEVYLARLIFFCLLVFALCFLVSNFNVLCVGFKEGGGSPRC